VDRDLIGLQGHVEKFADLMVKDVKTGQCYRADKLIEEWIEKHLAKHQKSLKPEEAEKLQRIAHEADSYEEARINAVIQDLKIKAPDTNNDLSEAIPFNLMFSTQIGPTGYMKGFLRPETAQGIFINFRRLLEYNNGRMPFAAA